MGKTEKQWEENHAIKVTKIPKTKLRIYGMNETKKHVQIRYRFVIPRLKLPKLRSHYLLAVKFRKKKHFVGVVFYWDNFVERLSCHRDKLSFSTREGFENFCPKI